VIVSPPPAESPAKAIDSGHPALPEELLVGRDHVLHICRERVLRYVRDHPDARIADLAAAFAFTIGVRTTSKIVDRLGKQGWLERRPNPANRRSSLLALTSAGESVVSRAEPAWQAAIQEILGGAVTPDDLAALSLAFAALRSDLERRRLGLPAG
jgi:MarR family multiple antibiotic resistance transcriptional regulator